MFKKFLVCALMSIFVTNSAVYASTSATIQHLEGPSNAKTDLVRVNPNEKILLKDNRLEIAFSENFNSKYYQKGDLVQFTFLSDVRTQEGLLVIPCGTTLLAKIDCIDKPKWMSRNARIALEFEKLVYADGTIVPICADLVTKNGYLQKGAGDTAKKIAAYTLSIGAVGTGLGAAMGVAAGNVITGVIIGGSVGGGVGLLSGIVSPGLHYKVKQGTCIRIELKDSLTLPQNCP